MSFPLPPRVDGFFFNNDFLKSALNISLVGASNTITIEGTRFADTAQFVLSSPDVRLSDFVVTAIDPTNSGEPDEYRLQGTFTARGFGLLGKLLGWKYQVRLALYNAGAQAGPLSVPKAPAAQP